MPEDSQTPFRASDEARDRFAKALDDTHPATDEIQPEEAYDEGLSGAAETSEPNAGNAVIGYNRPAEENKHSRGGHHGHDKAA